MTEYPDGVRRILPGQNVDLEPGFVQPYYVSQSIAVASSSTGTVTVNFTDPDFIYYIDEIHISPESFTEFAASYHINDIPCAVLCTCGYGLFTPRNNPSIMFISGEHLDVQVTNLDASSRTFTVRINGTKVVRPSGFGKPPYTIFSATPTVGYLPLSVTFTDESLYSPTEWEWDFGDDSEAGTDQNPTHTYTVEGTYSPSLKASNEYGFDSYVRENYITVYGYDDLTTFTEVDSSSTLTVTPSNCTFTSMPRNVDSYLYYDFGADYFGAIDVSFTACITSTAANGVCFLLGFSNAVGNLRTTSGIKLVVRANLASSSAPAIEIVLYNGTSVVTYNSYTGSSGTVYYLRLVRNAGSTTATLYIYSDVAHTNLITSLAITNASVNTSFRYGYVVSSYNDGNASTISGYVENVRDML